MVDSVRFFASRHLVNVTPPAEPPILTAATQLSPISIRLTYDRPLQEIPIPGITIIGRFAAIKTQELDLKWSTWTAGRLTVLGPPNDSLAFLTRDAKVTVPFGPARVSYQPGPGLDDIKSKATGDPAAPFDVTLPFP